MDVVVARLFAAAEQSGIALAQSHKDEILGAVDGLADAVVDDIVTSIADNLPSGGIKSEVWGPIKGALLSSQTEMDQKLNDRMATAFDTIIAVLKKAAQ